MQDMKTYHNFGFKLCGKCKECGDTTALALKLCKKRGNTTVLASKLCKRCGISTVLASKLVKLTLCKTCGNITVFLVKKHRQIVCFISASQQDRGCQTLPNQWFYIASKLWLWGCSHSQKIFEEIIRFWSCAHMGQALTPEFIDRPAPPPKHTILDNIAETKCMFVLCFFVFFLFPFDFAAPNPLLHS